MHRYKTSKKFEILLFLSEFMILLVFSYFTALVLAQALDPHISNYPTCSGRRDGIALIGLGICSGTFTATSLITLLFSTIIAVFNIKLLSVKGAEITKFLKLSVIFAFLAIFALNLFVLIRADFAIGFMYFVVAAVLMLFLLRKTKQPD